MMTKSDDEFNRRAENWKNILCEKVEIYFPEAHEKFNDNFERFLELVSYQITMYQEEDISRQLLTSTEAEKKIKKINITIAHLRDIASDQTFYFTSGLQEDQMLETLKFELEALVDKITSLLKDKADFIIKKKKEIANKKNAGSKTYHDKDFRRQVLDRQFSSYSYCLLNVLPVKSNPEFIKLYKILLSTIYPALNPEDSFSNYYKFEAFSQFEYIKMSK